MGPRKGYSRRKSYSSHRSRAGHRLRQLAWTREPHTHCPRYQASLVLENWAKEPGHPAAATKAGVSAHRTVIWDRLASALTTQRWLTRALVAVHLPTRHTWGGPLADSHPALPRRPPQALRADFGGDPSALALVSNCLAQRAHRQVRESDMKSRVGHRRSRDHSPGQEEEQEPAGFSGACPFPMMGSVTRAPATPHRHS